MKLAISCLTVASAISMAAATSCTSESARAWPFTPDNPDNPDNGGGRSCNGDLGCETIAAEGQCNALSLIDDEDSTCVEKLKKMKRAVDLDCSSNETCYTWVEDSLLCLDAVTGEYHDDVGGNGNANSGVYTAPNGDVQTVTGVSAEPTGTATAREDDETNSASTTASRAAATQTDTDTATSQSSSGSSSASRSSSASQSAAAAQQTGGTEHQAMMLPALFAVAAVPAIVAVL